MRQQLLQQVTKGTRFDALQAVDLPGVMAGVERCGAKVAQQRVCTPYQNVVAVQVAVHQLAVVQVVGSAGDAVGNANGITGAEVGTRCIDVAGAAGKARRACQGLEVLGDAGHDDALLSAGVAF